MSDIRQIILELEAQGLWEVTHFLARTPAKDSWVGLVYVRRHVGTTAPFYLGLESIPLSKENIEARLSTCKLPQPILWKIDRGCWIDPDGAIWMADVEDPVGDENKILLVRSTAGCHWTWRDYRKRFLIGNKTS